MGEWSVDDELRQRGLESADDGRIQLIRATASSYVERGLLDPAGRRLRLSTGCPRHCICWQGDRQALAPQDPAVDALRLPLIGRPYGGPGILGVGKKVRRGGGG